MSSNRTEVLICGSGSAGVTAALWLALHKIPCKILDKRSGPMKMGQADGVQCRTVEIFESFGVSEEMLREAYHVLEVAFWSADAEGTLRRTRTTADTAPGLTHMPHVILNQARVNGLLLEAMQRANGQDVDYGWEVKGVEVNSEKAEDPEAYPVKVTAEKDGKEEVFEAKYVLGCDGAHSNVRKSLGYKMIGDSTDAVWGVMDIYPQTNFPDVRRKSTIHSAYGNLLIIPREGGSLVRFYIELPEGTVAKSVKLEDLHAAAKKIFTGYKMDFADTFWWSAYAIGQRLADHFSKDNRVFLTGDACHTHSPKAGQGMNVSLQDGYNIGWKLAEVLKKQAPPELLKTYNIEREKVAADLINFDREWAKIFAVKVNQSNGDHDAIAKKFSDTFIKNGRYTAGLTATYDDSMLTSAARSTQTLARYVTVGMRFPSAQVVRYCDAKAMQIARALPADGRWRILIFAGDIRDSCKAEKLKKLTKMAEYLDGPKGPVRRFTRKDADIDSFIEPIVILHGERHGVEQEQIPDYFWPSTGKWKMRDLHKTFIDDESYNSGHGRAYEHFGVEPDEGAVVIVRPDHYVSLVTSLDDHDGIGKLFEGFALPQQ
ncbi:hypothetical protein NA57DRAFT_48666 [Rhizodiscina lignyota]|uniref:Phenol 2-monooxygenase n=1 Tax=Rhizodiscina lignyota TaxID=1504668 RepID=A0A9P4I689_9PEZI|nr:hypothetical protein NA57DRAFT_48666 [Rhizodiscina lignyota]